MNAEIWLGEYFSPRASTQASPLLAFDDLVRHHVLSSCGDRIGEAAADQPLDRKQRVFGVGDGLPLGGLSDQTLAFFGERDHRRGGAGPFGVLNNFDVAAFHDRDARIRGAEIDTNNFAHVFTPNSANPPLGPIRQPGCGSPAGSSAMAEGYIGSESDPTSAAGPVWGQK